MLNLITGKRGTPHVSAQDDGTIWRAIIGNGSVVFPFGSKFATTFSGRVVTISDGIGMNQGRMFRVEGTESVTIDSASPQRHDIICMKIEINPSTDISTASWHVVKGNDGSSATPTVTTGDIDAGDTTILMPMFEVSIRQSGILSVTPLFNMFAYPYFTETKEVTLSLTSSTSQTKAHGISDIGNWGVVEAYITNGTVYYPLSYAATGTAYAGYRYDGSNITFAFGSSWSGYTAHVVFGRRR